MIALGPNFQIWNHLGLVAYGPRINNISIIDYIPLKISITALATSYNLICLNKFLFFGWTWTPIFTAHLTSTINCRHTADRMIMKLTIVTVDTLNIMLCYFHRFWIKINWKNKLSKKKRARTYDHDCIVYLVFHKILSLMVCI